MSPGTGVFPGLVAFVAPNPVVLSRTPGERFRAKGLTPFQAAT